MAKNIVNRNLNIEVLRIIAMFMIIAGHAITHTDILDNISGYNFYIIKFFEIVFNVATNVYVLISGYLLCDKTFKFRKLFGLWFQVFFYSVLIYFILLLTNQIQFSILDCVKVILPISGNRYWFARVYLGLYILSPFLNILIKNLTKKQFQYLLIIFTILFSLWGSFVPFATTLNPEGGNSIIWFCILYLFAAYIKIHGVPIKSFKVLFVLTISLFVFSFISSISIKWFSSMIGLGGRGASQFTTFNSFPMLFGAVGLLCIFIKLPKIYKYSKIIQWFSLSTFSVYLIHDNRHLRDVLWNFCQINQLASKPYIALYVLVVALLVFAVCALIDKILYVQINKLITKIKFKQIQEKIDAFLYV